MNTSKIIAFFNFFTLLYACMSLGEVNFEEACILNPDLVFDGQECRCSVNNEVIQPFISLDVDYCLEVTTIKNSCDELAKRNGLPLKFINNRCYCPASEEYLSAAAYNPIFPFFGYSRIIRAAIAPMAIDRCIKAQKNYDSSLPILPQARNLRISSTSLSKHNEKLYIVERLSGEKLTVNSVGIEGDARDQPNPQGSLTLFNYLMKTNMADYFGLVDDDHYLTLPSVENLNKAIDTFNETLEQKNAISFKYFIAHSSLPISSDDYLLSLSNQQIPIAEVTFGTPMPKIDAVGLQILFFHDSTLHVPFFLTLAPQIAKLIIEEIKDIYDFKDFYQKMDPDGFETSSTKAFFSHLINAIAQNLDKLTANTHVYYGKSKQNNHTNSEDLKLFAKTFRGAIQFGISGKMKSTSLEYKRSRKDLFTILIHSYFSYWGASKPLSPIEKEAKTTLDPAIKQIQSMINKFAQDKSSRDESFDQPFPLPFDLFDEPAIARYFDERMEFINLNIQNFRK